MIVRRYYLTETGEWRERPQTPGEAHPGKVLRTWTPEPEGPVLAAEWDLATVEPQTAVSSQAWR